MKLYIRNASSRDLLEAFPQLKDFNVKKEVFVEEGINIIKKPYRIERVFYYVNIFSLKRLIELQQAVCNDLIIQCHWYYKDSFELLIYDDWIE